MLSYIFEWATPFVLTLGLPVFRRRIRMHSQSQGDAVLRVRAALEDDFHHFRVELQCAGNRIVAISAQAPRHPYSLCPSAALPLQQLVGTALTSQAHALSRAIDPSQQCTHLLDLAGLACALAARGLSRRVYDIAVPMRVGGRTQARLSRDGTPLLVWEVQDLALIGPMPYAGVDLRVGMARWAWANLSDDEAEAALVLRRCTTISLGKGKPLDEQVHAQATGRCFVQQPERAPLALRQVGSTWDFTNDEPALCTDDEAWLAFAA